MMIKPQLGQRQQQQLLQLHIQQPKTILIMYSTTAFNSILHQHRRYIPLLQQGLIISQQQLQQLRLQQLLKNQKLLTHLILKHLSFSLNILLVQLVVLMIFIIFKTVTLLQILIIITTKLQQPKIHIHFLQLHLQFQQQ